METTIFKKHNPKICVIGLGYVGLPLALEFGKKYKTIGYDVSKSRVDELRKSIDKTNEVTVNDFSQSLNIKFTYEEDALNNIDIFICTVPTPVDQYNTPDLSALISASTLIGKKINKNSIVIYESTVYPGVTEDVCVPVIEKISNLALNIDFYAGYSPERINPGDKNHKISDILKVTSGSNAESATYIDNLYSSIIKAGTYKASSIKVAESAKVIENIQRDINIGLMNELSMIFNKMNINVNDVLDAAKTKWNFLPFEPGLVGGHCIGVDPYYLTYKANSIGIKTDIILSARTINDGMPLYLANKIVKKATKNNLLSKETNCLVLGISFKENCPDIRNSKVISLINELKEFGLNVDCYDPVADSSDVKNSYKLDLISNLKDKQYSIVIIAVAHEEFRNLGSDYIKSLCKDNCLVFDIKNLFNHKDFISI